MTRIGIHDLSVATTRRALSLSALAAARGVDPDKYRLGIGQDQLSVAGPEDDVVTLAAAAAAPVVADTDPARIRTVYVATESGIDQSKSAAVYVHRLLGLPTTCRAVEVKQACYGGTAALQAAVAQVASHPEERALVIASDVARYDIATPAEATQGAAAVAMLVSAEPDVLAIEPVSGIHTDEIDDFWRPNDRSTALVDGPRSVSAYLDAYLGAWDDYVARAREVSGDERAFAAFCHHQPFTRMAVKAQRHLAAQRGLLLDEDALAVTARYNRRIGNSYTASLFIALAALLDDERELAGARVGLFSYGSGSVGEFFTGTVGEGYRSRSRARALLTALDARENITVPEYERLHREWESSSFEDRTIAGAGGFRLAGVRAGARHYIATGEAGLSQA